MSGTAKLNMEVKITVTHEGEATCTNVQSMLNAMRSAVRKAFINYTGDEDFEVEVDVFFPVFEYTDDVAMLKAKAKNMIDNMEYDDLLKLVSNKIKE